MTFIVGIVTHWLGEKTYGEDMDNRAILATKEVCYDVF
jgi:hypothetical protein